jgi:ankyrin repeat protein
MMSDHGLDAWFHSFVDANANEWNTVARSLAEGNEGGYLSEYVEWDNNMYTPLHYAASMGDLDTVDKLIGKYNIPWI